MNSRRSFFFYFVIATSLLVSILVVALALVYAVSFRGYYTAHIRQDSLATVEAVRVLVRDYLQDSEQRLTAARGADSNADLLRYFEFASRSDPSVRYYQALSREGSVELMFPEREELIGTDTSGQSFFREGIESDGFRWRGAILSSQANEPVITGTVPYRDGLIAVQTSLVPMLQSVHEISTLSRGEIGVLDEKGTYLLHSNPDLVSQRVISPFAGLLEERPAGRMYSGGASYFYVSVPVDEIAGHVVFYQDYAAIRSDLVRSFVRLGAIAAAFLVPALFLAWGSGRLLLRPIVSTEQGIRRIAAGDYSVRFGELPFSELNSLIVSINDMAGRIEQRQQELEEARLTAENANRAKDRFLANMSHELRTPLNGIRGMASLLGEEISDPATVRKIGLINSSVDVISQVVGDILDYALIERKELKLNPVVFRPFDLVRDLTGLVRFQAEERKIDVRLDYRAHRELYVSADKVRISQVLLNLLTNAIKYTREGSIELSVRELEGNHDLHRFEFAVSDTGIGIPSSDLQRVFDRFTQLDDSTTKAGRGIGLGLSITRELVKIMEGTIAVESREGVGSRFTVLLPLTAAAVPAGPPPTGEQRAMNPGERTILIAEDEAINRMYLSSHLRGAGYRVFEAVNGREACDYACKLRPDLILLDISMPVMDGWTAAREIRRNPDLSGVRILALTAHAREEVRRRSIELGMEGFITKPIDERELDRAVAELLSDSLPPAD